MSAITKAVIQRETEQRALEQLILPFSLDEVQGVSIYLCASQGVGFGIGCAMNGKDMRGWKGQIGSFFIM